ncbi:MAG: hypothetical protein GHCLOJNM_04280 [bacterium]|nr:hypothetical protein [bacterium]
MKDPAEFTPIELYRAGFQAQVEKFGVAGVTRFMLLLERGRGNYTEERQEILKAVALAEASARTRKWM